MKKINGDAEVKGGGISICREDRVKRVGSGGERSKKKCEGGGSCIGDSNTNLKERSWRWKSP